MRINVKRFHVSLDDLREETEKVRYGRKMSMEHLIMLIAAVVDDRSNFNVLY